MNQKIIIIFMLFLCAFFVGCSGSNTQKTINISGKTMGTTFNVVVIDEDEKYDQNELTEIIERVLKDVNSKLSNWYKSSEISKFNTLRELSPTSHFKSFFASHRS